MKIALLTDGIWPFVVGGMQKHSYLLAKYLAAQSVQVVITHPRLNETEKAKLKHLFTPAEWSNIEWINISPPAASRIPGHYLLESYRYSKSVYDAISGIADLDFVYAKGLTSWFWLRKRHKSRIPVGINIHGYEFLQKHANWRERINAWMFYFPFRYINRKADFVFSYGGRISGHIRQLGVDPVKIIELPGAVEADWVRQSITHSGGRRSFAFMGRYERRKGVEELSAVLKQLLQQNEAFLFQFIGPIPDEVKIASPQIIYHGTIREKEDLLKLLGQTDVLVCPSFSEGMPNVILEAMACGCAIIASDVGAVNQVVDKSNGWLIPAGSKSSLLRAMHDSLAIPAESLDSMKWASINRINAFHTWPIMVKRTITEIRKRLN